MHPTAKLTTATLLAAPVLVGVAAARRALPAGLNVSGHVHSGQVRLLVDLTYRAEGQSISGQQIFDVVEQLIDRAERFLVLDIKELDAMTMFALSGSILLIAISILIVRYGHVRFPYTDGSDLQSRND